MGYLIVEMLVSLAVAFAVGFASAWLIQRSFAERRVQKLRDWVTEAEKVCERWEVALEEARTVLVAFDRQLLNTRVRAAGSARDSETVGNTLHGKIVYLERAGEEKRLDTGNIANWQGRYAGLGAKYADAEQRVAELKSRLSSLRQQNSPAPPMRATDMPETPTGTQEPTDDLKQVSGIGPVFERALNEMGICQFEQLARLTEQDLERVAARLEIVPYRIVRDRWVEQARELAGPS